MSGTRLGELNGRWALLLKITLVCVPIVTTIGLATFLPWSVWVTDKIYAHESNISRFDSMDVRVNALQAEMRTLPPQEWKTRIIKVEDAAIENRESHAEIKVTLIENKATLQEIKARLDKQ